MSHYLKLVMDAIFGKTNFRNEIVWCYSGPAKATKNFPRKHDVILFYAKDHARSPFFCEAVRVRHKRQTPSGGVGMAAGNKTRIEVQEAEAEQIARGKLCPDWWADIGSGSHMPKTERVGYPTQKPLALLDRIIKASSEKGHMVLDPFCGCATTCVSADALKREWIGIDISEKAAELVRRRIDDLTRQIIHRNDIPARTDLGKIPRYNSPENKTRLYGEQEGYCKGCKTHFKSRNLEVDHIISRTKGGTNHISNLQLLCGYCNRIKGDRGMEYLKSALRIGL